VRIKFPDEYILQGIFGAKETTKDLYDFVAENLPVRGRAFTLAKTPPRRVVKSNSSFLYKADTEANGMVFV